MRLLLALLLASLVAVAGPVAKLPADCWMVVHFDAAALMKTDFYKLLAPVLRDALEDELEDLQKKVGFDLERDLESVTIGFAAESFDEENPGFLVARGRIDAAKFDAAAAEAHDYVTTKREGVTIYSLKSGDAESCECMAIVGGNTFAMAWTRENLDRLLASLSGSAAASAACDRVEKNATGLVGFAMAPTAKLREDLRANPETAGFAGVRAAWATLATTADGVKISYAAEFGSEDEAKLGEAEVKKHLAGSDALRGAPCDREGAVVRGQFAFSAADMVKRVVQELGWEEDRAEGELEGEETPLKDEGTEPPPKEDESTPDGG